MNRFVLASSILEYISIISEISPSTTTAVSVGVLAKHLKYDKGDVWQYDDTLFLRRINEFVNNLEK